MRALGRSLYSLDPMFRGCGIIRGQRPPEPPDCERMSRWALSTRLPTNGSVNTVLPGWHRTSVARIMLAVLWFYSQDSLTIRIETRYDNGTAEYVLVVHWSADHRQEERFATPILFRRRLAELDTQINADGWRKDGSPVLLPDGWPDTLPDN